MTTTETSSLDLSITLSEGLLELLITQLVLLEDSVMPYSEMKNKKTTFMDMETDVLITIIITMATTTMITTMDTDITMVTTTGIITTVTTTGIITMVTMVT